MSVWRVDLERTIKGDMTMPRSGVIVTKEYTGDTEYDVELQVEADIIEWVKDNPGSPYAWIIEIYPTKRGKMESQRSHGAGQN